jgi:hypothetical protein
VSALGGHVAFRHSYSNQQVFDEVKDALQDADTPTCEDADTPARPYADTRYPECSGVFATSGSAFCNLEIEATALSTSSPETNALKVTLIW